MDGPASSSRATILVVDDDPDSADCLTILLGQWGYSARAAYDGAGALALYESERPDIVLLDLGMPGMSGFDLARQLAHRDPRPTLIAVSGYAGPVGGRELAEHGFAWAIVKPVEAAALREILHRFAGASPA